MSLISYLSTIYFSCEDKMFQQYILYGNLHDEMRARMTKSLLIFTFFYLKDLLDSKIRLMAGPRGFEPRVFGFLLL
jgi:hypothetical protein